MPGCISTKTFLRFATTPCAKDPQLFHPARGGAGYGLPCVSGLPGVTGIIKDGDLLEIDGTNGIVKILERAT
jgi:hypothetical protein